MPLFFFLKSAFYEYKSKNGSKINKSSHEEKKHVNKKGEKMTKGQVKKMNRMKKKVKSIFERSIKTAESIKDNLIGMMAMNKLRKNARRLKRSMRGESAGRIR